MQTSYLAPVRDVTHSLMRRAGITTTPSKADTGVPLLARTGRPQQNARWMCSSPLHGMLVRHTPFLLQPLFRYLQVVPLLNSSPCHEGVWGSDVTVPCVLNLDDRLTHEPLYARGKNPWNPLDRKMGGSVQCKETVDHVRNRIPIPQTSSPWPVAILNHPCSQPHLRTFRALLPSKTTMLLLGYVPVQSGRWLPELGIRAMRTVLNAYGPPRHYTNIVGALILT
jgi:hypothetical protein